MRKKRRGLHLRASAKRARQQCVLERFREKALTFPAVACFRRAVRRAVAACPEASVAVAVRTRAPTFDWHADRVFHAASTMKVAVLIETYRRVERGALALDDALAVENCFRSAAGGGVFRIAEDSDEEIYDHLGGALPVRTLTERMVTRSSNLATNLLVERLGADAVERTARRLGAGTMRIRRGVEDRAAYRAGLSNTASARDLAALMNALMRGEAVSPQADRAMIETLAGQRYNSMIPAGLPSDTRVAHKTGWLDGLHHDAAIVCPPGEAVPYVLVVFTEGIRAHSRSARLGAEIARAAHEFVHAES